MNYSKQKNNQDGVALLFALGLLSLLLVIGLGFFTSTSISAKIANNNRNRSQAKTLSQAAISRVLIALMQYQHDTFTSTPSYLPRDFSEVYSHEVGTTEIENVPDDYKYVSAIRSNNLDLSISANKDAKIVREPINDSLKGDKSLLQFTNDTLSFIPKSKLDEYKNKLKDSDDTTSWVYLTTQKYDNEEIFVFDEIIGRFAYKVIPSVPSRINIHTFLAGTTKYFPEYKEDNSKIQTFPWCIGEESSNTPTPNNFRLGREIDELDIQNSIFAFNYVDRKNDVPQELSKLVETEGISDASLKKWFEFWLVDSKIKTYKQNGVEIITPPTPIANELFLGYKDNKEIALKRFNISYISGVDPETECNWYARFKLTEEQKNSDDIVEMIVRKPYSLAWPN